MSETFDFVVVGSGAGGLAAALVMRSLGKSVLVLEKSAYVGGVTAASGGVMWIPNNRFMKAEGVADSPEQALAYMDAVVGGAGEVPGATRERRTAYVDAAPRMLEFLIGQGLQFRRIPTYPDYYSDAPGASDRGRTVVSTLYDANRLGDWKARLRPGFLPMPLNLDEAMMLPRMKRSWAAKRVLARFILRNLRMKLSGKQLVTAGNALQGQMLEKALAAGVDIRTDTPVKDVVVEAGRATGVELGDGTRIGANLGVLINAGGFTHNQAMRDRHAPGTQQAWTMAPDCDTGEMIEAVAGHGVATAQMDVRVCHPIALPPGRPPTGIHGDLAKPHSLVVDQKGQRFMAEAGCYMDICGAMMTAPERVPSWLVMDSRYIANSMLAGSMAGPKKPDAWFESGFLKKADSLAELAGQIGVDAANLQASVDRFNTFARARHDDDFKRGDRFAERWSGDPDAPSPTLGTVEQGPFYAIQFFPGDVSTFGGLVTDVDARVLRDDGTPVEGLYATGTSTASVMGRASVGPGSSIGPSLTFGYVAARHAAGAGNALGAGA